MKQNPYCKNLKTVVFDIETTGLFSANDRIISASFCSEDGSGLRQYFTDGAEEDTLALIYEEICKYDVLITYNGDSFDIPFLLTRLKKRHVAEALPEFWNIDLYKWLKRYWPASTKMEHLRQKDAEAALGIAASRTDEISGKECVALYSRYLQLMDEESKNTILLHNADDVRQLGKISERLNFLPYHEIAYREGFMFKAGENKIFVKPAKEKQNYRLFTAKTQAGMVPACFYGDNYYLEYDSAGGDIRLKLFTGTEKEYEYADLRALPVDESAFSQLADYESGYLILSDSKGLKYKSINLLQKEMMRSLFI